MGIELTPGMTNVVRFPLEKRVKPSLDLMRELQPDCREMDMVIEAFGFDDSIFDAQDSADEEMANYIANNVRPEPGEEKRRTELDALLVPIVNRAIDARRNAHEAALSSVSAQRLLVKAQSEGGYWLTPLVDQANARSTYAAHLLVDAYVACGQAEGSERAIGFARRNEEAHALFSGESLPSASS